MEAGAQQQQQQQKLKTSPFIIIQFACELLLNVIFYNFKCSKIIGQVSFTFTYNRTDIFKVRANYDLIFWNRREYLYGRHYCHGNIFFVLKAVLLYMNIWTLAPQKLKRLEFS